MTLKLLIVEDDVSLQQMLTWDFEDLGYAVTAVTTCREAREALARCHFNLALIDFHLPDGTGADLLPEMRTQYPDMPVIISSGLACAETASKVVSDQGAFRFVQKPVHAETLHQVFQAALQNRSH